MAYDPVPSHHITGITTSAGNLIIPLTSVVDDADNAQLTAEEVADATGDIRKVVFALAEMLYSVYAGMATADRPTQMTLTRSKNASESTEYRYHNMQFICAVATPAVVDVADEPA